VAALLRVGGRKVKCAAKARQGGFQYLLKD
jgi:hypothetical protein